MEACSHKRFADAVGEVAAWEKIISSKATEWAGLSDVRNTFKDADGVTVGERVYTIFNICHNRFRLVVQINFKFKMVFFKFLMTHAEYGKNEWKESLKIEQRRQGLL